MTVYEVCYTAESAPDGFGRLYLTSKAAAQHAAADIKREHRRQVSARLAAEKTADYYDWPALPGEEPRPEVSKLTFTGTPLEMIVKALRYRA